MISIIRKAHCPARAAWAAALALIAVGVLLAWPASPALALDDAASQSPCVPTEQQIESYAADGTLDARMQAMEQLDHAQPSVSLTQQALARQASLGENGAATLSSVPSAWTSGMGTVGPARVLALRVSFPDYAFAESDSLSALDALINGGGSSAFPDESLHAYYQRASYGALDISGTAVDYQAKHERSYYESNLSALFAEALDALEDTCDLAQFDGNGDGYIDCVYLHFAGPDSGWGGTWWSKEWTVPNQAGPDISERTWDGKRLWNVCLLADASSASGAAATAIHETGHALGLPDLYSYQKASGVQVERSGSLTFDLMDDKVGDTNAFFKWMLGWVDESKVVRVVANADGITVQRGGVREHFEGHSIDQALSAFTEDDVTACGGFIAVSNSDELLDPAKGLFSSFYLLQYDHFAGNQSVCYSRDGQAFVLPSGFRLFRVQAALTQDGNTYQHSNTSGQPGNQLIELVDPDMGEAHGITSGFAPASLTGTGYGCMLYAGQTVSPTTYPSTNFGESLGGGFTGLTFSVTESGQDSGTVSISWSDADAPTPSKFSLSFKPSGLLNWGSATFTMSYAARYAASEHNAYPYLVINDKKVFVDASASGDTITLPYRLNPGEVPLESTCEAVFPAGCFQLAGSESQQVLSDEIRVPFSLSGLTSFATWGFYDLPSDYLLRNVGISSVFARDDGSQCFLKAAGQALYLETIDSQDPSSVSEARIEGAVLPTYFETSTVLRVALLPDDRCFMTVSFEDLGASDLTRAYVIDLSTCSVLEQAPLGEYTGVFRTFALGKSSAVGTYAYRFDLNDGFVLSSVFEGADAQGEQGQTAGEGEAFAADAADGHMLWTRASDVFNAGGGLIAATFSRSNPGNPTDVTLEVRLYEADEVEALMAAAPAQLDPAALADFTDQLTPVRTCEVGGYQAVGDVSATAEATYVLASARVDPLHSPEAYREGLLAKFDLEGAQTAQLELAPAGSVTASCTNVVVGQHGAVAVSRIAVGQRGAFEPQETHVFDSSLQPAGSYDCLANATGGWVNGRWVALGWDCARFAGGWSVAGAPPAAADGGSAPDADGAHAEAGAEEDVAFSQVDARNADDSYDERVHVRYAVTDVIDAADAPDDPGDPGEPDDPVDPEGPQGPGGSDDPDARDEPGSAGAQESLGRALAETGDGPVAVALALCLAAAASLAVLRCVKRCGRS